MENRNYRKDVKALSNHAQTMSVDGLQLAILNDWNNPEWPAILFDALNIALEKKMGKRAYTAWFNALPMKG